MTRILVATVPITGHVRPGLPIASELVREGHEVFWYTGETFEPLIARTGARFVTCTAHASPDRLGEDVLQSMDGQRDGLAGFRRIIRELFVDPIPAYARELAPIVDELRPDVIVTDHCFAAGPMLARQRQIKSVVYVIGPLAVSSLDTAPSGTGLLPSSSPLGRLRNQALNLLMSRVLFRDVQRAAVRAAEEVGFPPLDAFLTDWTVRIADRYLVATIPEFEYPRSDMPGAVEFIGPLLPEGIDAWDPPSWWPELEQARREGRPVLLLTQGTAATDPGQLLLPGISALSGMDALVVATTATADPESVLPRQQRPPNVRMERFVPFTELLPSTNLMITNGGYGGVQMALAFGVPLVTAGTSEDKMEVNKRVQWSGGGVSLSTSHPSPKRILSAVTSVLNDPRYLERARELQACYAQYSGARYAAHAIVQTARESASGRRLG
jgi:MGT family glycosyltransferase